MEEKLHVADPKFGTNALLLLLSMVVVWYYIVLID